MALGWRCWARSSSRFATGSLHAHSCTWTGSMRSKLLVFKRISSGRLRVRFALIAIVRSTSALTTAFAAALSC